MNVKKFFKKYTDIQVSRHELKQLIYKDFMYIFSAHELDGQIKQLEAKHSLLIVRHSGEANQYLWIPKGFRDDKTRLALTLVNTIKDSV